MFKKIILVLALVFFLSGFNLARAEIVINEIMYDPKDTDANAGGEWIEIKNTGSVSVNLTEWKFFEDDTNHGIVADGASEILPGEYAVISNDVASFKNYFTGFSKLLFKSSFSLNDGEKLAMKINKDTLVTDTNSITYKSEWGAKNDGNSLQLINGEWEPTLPTPGIANETVTTPPPPSADNSSNSESDSNNSNSSSSSSSSSSGSSSSSSGVAKVTEIPKIKTQIMAKTLGFVGIPLSFLAATYGLNGEQLRYGKYFWNFGDGDSKKVNLTDSQSFIHIYFYSGDYVVSLDYFSNPYIYQDIPDASSKITIKIIEADISISRVGEEKDFFIELTNNTDYSADISNWILASVKKSFPIPRNTILASKKKIIISSKITNFSVADKDTLKLMNPEREVVFDYSLARQDLAKEVITTKTIVQPKISTAVKIPEAAPIIDEQIFPKDLSASALNSGVSEQDEKSPYSSIVIPLASLIFVGASASAVYFIRQKKVISQTGDDFEILDE